MAANLGRFGKCCVLTGAGWTANWGAPVASEVWQSLLGDARVQGNAAIRELLLSEPSFEVALAAVSRAPFTDEDRKAFEAALLDVFVAMDREISRIDQSPGVNIYKVQELLFRTGRPRDGVDTGYIFTVNQDLFPERYLYNEHVTGAPHAALPGLVPKPGQSWFSSLTPAYSPDFVMSPATDLAAVRLQGQTNVVKLHGSFNWRTPDGRNLWVVGTEKTASIASHPLLTMYAEVFREVIGVGDMKLLIVGYGFGDEHINAAIADAVKSCGLQVFIWDSRQDLRAHMDRVPHGADIWSGLISISSRKLHEVFPSNQAITEEYRRICEACFGAI